MLSVAKTLLDFIFPITCVGCREQNTHCCESCFHSIDVAESPFMEAKSNTAIDAFLAPALHEENGPLAKLIHRFKYDGAREIAPLFVPLFRSMAQKRPDFFTNAVFIPVPLHFRRKNIRGFNQSEILAYEIGKICSRPIWNILRRHRYTRPQVELNGAQRKNNVQDAFSLKEKVRFDSSITYVLVDDVITTGSTMSECAKVLREYGAAKVYGLAIARAQ